MTFASKDSTVKYENSIATSLAFPADSLGYAFYVLYFRVTLYEFNAFLYISLYIKFYIIIFFKRGVCVSWTPT